MISRSYDPAILAEAVAPYPEIVAPTFDFEGWVGNKKNILYHDGEGSVGFLTYEYPGVFTGHWFFKVRGKDAINLAKEMLTDLFTNQGAVVIRGLTDVNLKAARFASRKLGFQSLGFVNYPDGEYELFYLTKDEYEKDTI